ncbi:predicted protein [Histoplasma capsulatum var. duboisii H88]|uniref:Predicted protein n=1 Tax=Ajellomyces capsulatus (strain H88) TaxID=544711 RepID=F0U4G8_AJEC8|nr:predicted protein [Histoplasma capsulatum var. duboisii H88]
MSWKKTVTVVVAWAKSAVYYFFKIRVKGFRVEVGQRVSKECSLDEIALRNILVVEDQLKLADFGQIGKVPHTPPDRNADNL